MSQTSRTSTNEHYDKALEILNTAPRYRLDGPGDPHMPGLAIDTLEHHIREMAARIERLQRLCNGWARAQGYGIGSKRWADLIDAIKDCQDHGDLPNDGSNGR